jgi:hypothetical protein
VSLPNRAALGCVLLTALSSGCLTVQTRHGHDSCYEHHGMWCGNYGIGFEEARAAALAALTHLKMPVYHEGPLGRGIFIDTRTPEDFEARVIIAPLGHHGGGTRIGVRLTGFGTHRAVCARLLDEITRHLDMGGYAPAVPIAPVPLPPTTTPASSPISAAPAPTESSDASLPLQSD